jgi:protein-disulfide isomerase
MIDLNRRTLLAGSALFAVQASSGAFAQAAAPQPIGPAYSAEDLAQPGPLGDKILGNNLAPVTCYEYASLTCGHCAAFHANGYKHLKEKYIDTGKVKYILREFPLDPLASAGFMLSHCAGEGKYYPMIDLLFAQQRVWTQTDKPVDALLGLVRQTGFSQESFETCLRNQSIYDGVNAARQRGTEKFSVDSTPTFFFNGRKYTGALSAQQLDAIIEPLLKA